MNIGIAPTIKFGGGSLMIWAYFCWNKFGPIVTIQGTMNQEKYIKVLQKNLFHFGNE